MSENTAPAGGTAKRRKPKQRPWKSWKSEREQACDREGYHIFCLGANRCSMCGFDRYAQTGRSES